LIFHCQLSVVTNSPLSILHFQLSIVNCPLSIVHYPLSTITFTLHFQLSIVIYQLSTVHCQFSTVHCPLSIIPSNPFLLRIASCCALTDVFHLTVSEPPGERGLELLAFPASIGAAYNAGISIYCAPGCRI
jgi:hypothetical protein